MSAYFTGKDLPVQLGRQLGRGGEGAVFEVPGQVALVAKLYHQSPNGKKQSKLGFMASHGTESLFEYCAWPKDTLHKSRSGPVVGFLMPKVVGKAPVHMLYSPAHRKQEYPDVAWDFLLYVARNTAAAFETLHRHQHVLGDVNQGNVMVGKDSKVMLIDCDSYQVNAQGTMHLCEVGVSHFTPPELQGRTSFDTVQRTLNHDAFGLALLVFHLLFGGRHPYAGRPLRKDVGDSLETDIQALRYAYGSDASKRGISPPPNSIPIDLVPAEIQRMFVAAFTEAGVQGRRPTATDWVRELDNVRSRLKRCGQSKSHIFPTHLAKCPWCALDDTGVVYFIDLGQPFSPGLSNFSMAKVWAAIEASSKYIALEIPKPSDFSVIATPLPTELTNGDDRIWMKIACVLIGLGICAAFPNFIVPILICVWIAWSVIGAKDNGPKLAELRRRKDALADASNAYDILHRQLQSELARDVFSSKKVELVKLREEHASLDAKEKAELEKLHATAEKRQRQNYLERFFIDTATIPGVGAAKKAALRSFGIETAADVSFNKVSNVKGFGDVLTRSVVDWRDGHVAKFRFQPSQAITPAEITRIRSAVAARRRAIESALMAAPEAFQVQKTQIATVLARAKPDLITAARRVAQAVADDSVAKQS
jgi:DNA-binding helix-hairpin-helix protein with protein kinase domain